MKRGGGRGDPGAPQGSPGPSTCPGSHQHPWGPPLFSETPPPPLSPPLAADLSPRLRNALESPGFLFGSLCFKSHGIWDL